MINDILSDSLQPLSDEDLRPMSEAIENMDIHEYEPERTQGSETGSGEDIYGI